MQNDFIIKKSPDGKSFYLYAYLGNNSIVKVPDGVTHINSYAFADDEHPNDTITKIILPNTLTNIERNGFAFCRALKDIIWSSNKNFKIMDVHIFKGCKSLKKISIPETVTAITSFIMPSNLKTVEIHDDLTFVGQSSFIYEDIARKDFLFYNFDTIRILLLNPNYKIIDGFMVNIKHKIALFYVDRDKKEVSIPDCIKILAPYCFDEYGYFEHGYDENTYRKTKLVPVEKILIPATVKKIEDGAFYYCKKLIGVVYKGESTEIKIAKEAFIECGAMSSFESKIICADTVVNTKKSRTTNMRLERIVIIYKEIKKGTFPSTNKLRDKCRLEFDSEKLSTATISRDIEFLRDRFRAPIEYNSSRKGYYYSSDFELRF